MNIVLATMLTKEYAVCPECGSDKIDNGEGALHIEENTFVRSCKCGWEIKVDAEDPHGPCENCIKADWIDMYGTMIYGCDMSHCIADEERDG